MKHKPTILIIFVLAIFSTARAQYTGGENDGYGKAFPNDISNPCLVVLPVELLHFKGEFNIYSEQVELNWTTASEINNNYFEIYHSVDGIQWISFKRINGKGNSSSLSNYSTTHNPANGINYYKLEQVDLTGKRSTSQVITVTAPLNPWQVAFFPNPAEYSLTIRTNSIERINLDIYNFSGLLIYSESWNNNTEHTISMTELPDGIYFIKVQSRLNITQDKILKMSK